MLTSHSLVAFAMAPVSDGTFDQLPPDTLHPHHWELPLIPGYPTNPQDATEQAAKGFRMILEDYEFQSPRAYHLFVNGVPEAVPGVIAEFLETALTSKDSLTLFYPTPGKSWLPTLTLIGRTSDKDCALTVYDTALE